MVLKGVKRPKTGGRVKGTPNKFSGSAREAIQLAAEGLGGVQRLVIWAQMDPANERIFWGQIYPRLVPHEVTGANGGPVQIARVVHEHLAALPTMQPSVVVKTDI